MTGSIVARRYANALFALKNQSGLKGLERCGEDLTALAGLLDESPELARLFRNPTFTVKEKEAVLGKLAKKLSLTADVQNFCRLLAEKGRLDALADIVRQFGTLLDRRKDIKRGMLITAVPLDEKKQAGILAELEKKAGCKLVLEFKTDPAILGGMLLKIGDNVLDASLQAQLSLLKDTITRG